MYETYFDDSGTSAQSSIAIAACYVSTEPRWKQFARSWDAIRTEEGFEVFHMAEFVAPREQGHKPWCDWDNAKKNRVYARLAAAINDNKRIGIGAAIPKEIYDRVPDRIREHYGFEHYTFAVRMCLMKVAEWRDKCLNTLPMQYIFDWESKESSKRIEISQLLDGCHEKLKPFFGLDTGGYDFKHKEEFKALQAADILAWQINCYMPNIYPGGETEESVRNLCHPGFRVLRQDQEMDIGFFTAPYMLEWINRIEKYESEHGIIY